MIVYIDIKNFFYGFFYLLDSGITKFFDLTRIGVDKMVVLVVKIRFFVLRLIFSKLVFSNQSTLQQKFDRIVESCPADSVIFIFHFDVKRLYIKVLFTVVNFK